MRGRLTDVVKVILHVEVGGVDEEGGVRSDGALCVVVVVAVAVADACAVIGEYARRSACAGCGGARDHSPH